MKTSTFLTALTLILAGEIFLLTNLGYGSWAFISQLAKFWPVILILVGLGFFFGNHIPAWMAVTITVVLVIGVAIFAWVTPGTTTQSGEKSHLSVEQTHYPDVTSGELVIKFGGGKLSVDSTSDYLVEGSLRGIGATKDIAESDTTLRVDLWQHQNNIRLFGGNEINEWDIGLSKELVWEIRVDAGAVAGKMDLFDIPINKLDLKVGAGDVDLVLGNKSEHTDVNVDAGASDIKIQVPESAGVKVRLKGALTNSNLNRLGWKQANGYYISPNYEEASSVIEIELKMGVANFHLEILEDV